MKTTWFFKIMLVLSFLMIGCKASEKTTKVVMEQKRDSISFHVETIKSRPMIQNWVIEQICDSSGVSKDFNQTIIQGGDSINLAMKNNQFSFSLKTFDSVRFKSIKEFREGYQFKSENNSNEVVRNVVPAWCWYSVLLNFIFLMVFGAWIYRRYFSI